MKKMFVTAVVCTAILTLNFKSYKEQIKEVKREVSSRGLNNKYAILIDYSIQSGKYRGFLVNLKTNTIEKSFLVMHGEGSKAILGIPTRFSNQGGSKATSLGFSVLGGKSHSSYGIKRKYSMIGINNTNNNNASRLIVLHSSNWIPNIQTFPIPIGQSMGCPTVSNNTLRYLERVIKKQKNKKIIIYNFI